ncbi:hypothetical protein NKH85_12960 [Mesorhizobium sp. M0924]|uniref:hypothetical protein n=1 Tax=unclassified Mesorhizobium TaxID=325217 RepID=UPI003335FE29
MRFYFELRHELADIYWSDKEVNQLGVKAEIDMTEVDLNDEPLKSWSLLLEQGRRQKKLPKLIDQIVEQHAGLSELAAKFLQETDDNANLPLSTIDLSSISFDGAEEAKLFAALVEALKNTPQGFVELALKTSPLTVEDVDGALPGKNTVEAKAAMQLYLSQVSRHEQALQSQKSEMSRSISQLRDLIRSTKSAAAPREPDSKVLSTPGASDFSVKQYHESLDAYKSDLTKYNDAQAKIPAMEAELASKETDAKRLDSEIESSRLDQVPVKKSYEAAISVARDRDIIACLSDLLDRAPPLLSDGSFEGFALYLLAASLGERFQHVLAQTGSVQTVSDLLSNKKEAIGEQIEKASDQLGRLWLGSASFLQHVLAENRGGLDAIAAKLAELPAAALAGKLDDFHKLQKVDLPEVPDSKGRMNPADLADDKKKRHSGRAMTVKHIEALKNELDNGAPELSAMIDAVKASVDGMLADMTARYDASAAQATWWMQALISNATTSTEVSRSTADFCAALNIEADRRAGTKVEDMIDQAIGRQLLTKDATETIGKHGLTRYLTAKADLRQKRADSEKLVIAFGDAERISSQIPAQVRDEYMASFQVVLAISVIPFANIIASVVQSRSISTLKEVLGSDIPEYADLARRAPRLVAIAALVSVLGAVGCGVVLLHLYPIEDDPIPFGTIGAAGAYAVNVLLAVINWIRLRGYARQAK